MSTSLLEKLAKEVVKNDGNGKKPEGSKPGAEDKNDKPAGKPEKPSEGKSKPADSADKGGSKDKKTTEKTPAFGKKPDNKKEQAPEGGKDSKGKDSAFNGNGNANGGGSEQGYDGDEPGGEKEIPGNESAEGPAVPGAMNIDPRAVIDFFAQNPMPNDEMFHEFAESAGLDIHAAESVAYALASKYVMFLRGGKSNETQLDMSQIDPQQLDMGMQVEMEHTADPATAKKIALDHLAESADYYTKLQQMESGDQAGTPIVAEPIAK